jgi:hypothetical protein
MALKVYSETIAICTGCLPYRISARKLFHSCVRRVKRKDNKLIGACLSDNDKMPLGSMAFRPLAADSDVPIWLKAALARTMKICTNYFVTYFAVVTLSARSYTRTTTTCSAAGAGAATGAGLPFFRFCSTGSSGAGGVLLSSTVKS